MATDEEKQAYRDALADWQEKLAAVQPETLGQAARIPGMTPAALAISAITKPPDFSLKLTCPAIP